MRMIPIAGALLAALTACSAEADPAPDSEPLFELSPEISVEIGAVSGPSLHVARRAVDFGKIWQGAVREVVFPIISAGTEPLHIKRVHASCGCTLVEARVVAGDGTVRPLVYDEDLAPGTRVEVVARFDSRGRHGYEKKTVEVYSDDPQGGHSLEIGVETTEFLVVENSPLLFDRVFPSGALTKSTRITSHSGEAFSLRCSPSHPLPEGLSFELAPSGGASGAEGVQGAEWVLTVTISPEAAVGPLMGMLLLETDIELPDRGDVADAKPEVLDPRSRQATRETPQLLGGAQAASARPATHFIDLAITATVLAPLSPDKVYLSFGFLAAGAVTSSSARIECFDPERAEAFLAAPPTVAMTDPEGGALEHASAFTPTLRRVTPEDQSETSPHRPLTPGSYGAWDLEVAARGFSGEGKNRLMGRIEIGFEEADSVFLTFQVILRP